MGLYVCYKETKETAMGKYFFSTRDCSNSLPTAVYQPRVCYPLLQCLKCPSLAIGTICIGCHQGISEMLVIVPKGIKVFLNKILCMPELNNGPKYLCLVFFVAC